MEMTRKLLVSDETENLVKDKLQRVNRMIRNLEDNFDVNGSNYYLCIHYSLKKKGK